VIAHVSEGDTEDVNRAVSAARKAFDEGPWPKMTPYVKLCISFSFLLIVQFKAYMFFHHFFLLVCSLWEGEGSDEISNLCQLFLTHCYECAGKITYNISLC
jgi:hypothetical protein